VATRSGPKAKTTTGGESGTGNGKATRTTAASGAGKAKTTRTTAAASRTTAKAAAASATGATARARITPRRPARSKSKPGPTDTRGVTDMPLGEPTATVPADDSVMAASNARRALNPDMPRVAWLRSQLQQMEDRQRERLLKVGQLTLIAIVFITFVLQNAGGVNVHFLLFALNIRLIWVIFGCAFLGGLAGYLIGRPDKSLRALMPQKEKLGRTGNRTARS
jgi:uncharacterized integral membrane protein